MKRIKIKVYPLGKINDRSGFLDLFTEDDCLICTICSLIDRESLCEEELEIKDNCVTWDEDKFPNVYINDKINTPDKINKALKILEKDENNKFRYVFVNRDSLLNYNEKYDKLTELQKEILLEIKDKWINYPLMRFGQLLFNYTNLNLQTNILDLVTDSFQYSDIDLLKDLKAKKFKKKIKKFNKNKLECIPEIFLKGKK